MNASSRRSSASRSVLAPRDVKIAALRSCEAMRTEEPVGKRGSRFTHTVDTPSISRRCQSLGARINAELGEQRNIHPEARHRHSHIDRAAAGMGRDLYGFRLCGLPPTTGTEEIRFSMVMRSMRPLSIMAMVSTIALPIVRTLIFAAFHIGCDRHPDINVCGVLAIDLSTD